MPKADPGTGADPAKPNTGVDPAEPGPVGTGGGVPLEGFGGAAAAGSVAGLDPGSSAGPGLDPDPEPAAAPLLTSWGDDAMSFAVAAVLVLGLRGAGAETCMARLAMCCAAMIEMPSVLGSLPTFALSSARSSAPENTSGWSYLSKMVCTGIGGKPLSVSTEAVRGTKGKVR